jgi:hypothetical protein
MKSMKKVVTGLLLVIIVSSCSTTYKGIQTPDDVYYSPQRNINTVAQGQNRNTDRYNDFNDDNYLRMRVQNRARWCYLDDFSYWNDSRYYADNYWSWNSYNPYWYNGCWGNNFYCNPYQSFLFNTGWNNWNAPYCTVVYYSNPKAYFNGFSSRTNLTAFNNSYYNIPLTTTSKGEYYTSSSSYRNQPTLMRNNRPVRIFQSGNGTSNTGGRSGGFNTRSTTGSARRPPR